MVCVSLSQPHSRFSLSHIKSRSGIFRSSLMDVLASFTATNVLSATVIVLEVTALMTKSLLFSVLEVQPESVTPSPALNFVVKSAQPFTVILFVANVALLPASSAASGFTC